jgi:hypothetical protein
MNLTVIYITELRHSSEEIYHCWVVVQPDSEMGLHYVYWVNRTPNHSLTACKVLVWFW